MGYKLRREVRDLLPPDLLTASERVLLLEIADTCGDDTRAGWPGLEWLIDKCDVPTKKRVGEHLASIARKWFEIRVELGKDRHGKSFFAIPGRRMTFRLPTRAELVARHGDDKVPENQGLYTGKDPENQGAKVPKNQGGTSPNFRDPSPQLEPLKENPSSLSPRESSTAATPNAPKPQPEREIVEASPEPETRNPVHRLLLEASCPENDLDDVEEELRRRFEIRSPAWFRTAYANGDLPQLVGEVLEALAGPSATPSRAAFIETLKGDPTCDHGVEGGNIAWAHDGWMHCLRCRQLAGWTEGSSQGRIEDKGRKRSTAVLRAEQGLAVADEPDRKYGHGAYTLGQIRSPADQRVPAPRRSNRHVPYRDPVDISAYETSRI